ncbi:hypothetical protein KJ865_12680 [Myxococcota bacterium]|nr:hypothetical protein [Myxococcota bacterium]
MRKIKRAILSVYNKTGIVELASFLGTHGVIIYSTGGTASLLRENNIDVIDISDLTGFPEILDGRVKTLHPAVHGGILASTNPSHVDTIASMGINPIDCVVVNLYPFVETIAKEGITHSQAIEMIDIGGPTMLRAAAKNHERVSVLSDPDDYSEFMQRFEDGGIDLALRRAWAQKVFEQTSSYDKAIFDWMRG